MEKVNDSGDSVTDGTGDCDLYSKTKKKKNCRFVLTIGKKKNRIYRGNFIFEVFSSWVQTKQTVG